MKPALTAEEWHDLSFNDGTGLTVQLDGGIDKPSLSLWRTDADSESVARGSGASHALAALALHGQPFGFTREDVDAVRNAIANVYQIHGEWGVGPIDANDPEIAALRSLAARIEALLPPEDTK